ncbi:MAG: polyphosphate polymerase domain-containing protein [Bacteroidetes bacterium]|nr:polyphosphate polymerase domain-containing protein [Bacteroidota bacterium]MBS1940042.1 polyphosphate polymerase domain-containing protein [Bacteroidota bacterium]
MPAPPSVRDFAPITLKEMDDVALQFRMDTKFIFNASRLDELFTLLLAGYRLLEVEGERGVDYETRYFDTVGLKHYFDHHNGRTFRSKVRARRYGGSGQCVLEVKRRTGRGGTDKRRTPLSSLPVELNAEQQAFAAAQSGCTEPLFAVLDNSFHRYTLVHRERRERLTIDTGITFTHSKRQVALPGLVVAELKEARTGHGSPFATAMRRWAVPPTSFSKYCIGTALTDPTLKQNAFRPVLLQAERAANLLRA